MLKEQYIDAVVVICILIVYLIIALIVVREWKVRNNEKIHGERLRLLGEVSEQKL